ncbi:MAG: efflux RND transporter periplasmic adaptor subunit [Limnochordia bacterium]|jgi:multidrug resistance efflux pump
MTHYRRLVVWASVVTVLVVIGALFSKLYYDLTLEGSNPFQSVSPVRVSGVMRLQTSEARVVPAQQIDLAFPVSGQLSAILVELGQRVAKGDELARLDDSRLRLSVARAKENLRAAELGEVPFQIEQAKLELAAAELDLEATVLKAPFDGQVMAVPVVTGQTVTPNMHIVTLAQVEPLMVRTSIAQNALRHIAPGLAALVNLEAFPGQIWEGHVVRVGNQAVQTPHGIAVELLIQLDGPKEADPGDKAQTIVPGLTATTEILVPRKQGAIDIANWFIAALFILMLVMTYVISVIMTPKVEQIPDDGPGGRGGRMPGMGWGGGRGFGRF